MTDIQLRTLLTVLDIAIKELALKEGDVESMIKMLTILNVKSLILNILLTVRKEV